MKILLLLTVFSVTLFSSDEPKPETLTPSQKLPRVMELPVNKEHVPDNQDEAAPKPKTFAQLMAERSFKCAIL